MSLDLETRVPEQGGKAVCSSAALVSGQIKILRKNLKNVNFC